MASTNLKSPTSKTPASRLPAPSLFVGPPSRNASSTSLMPAPSNAPPSGRPALTRQSSRLRNDTNTTAPESIGSPAAPDLKSPPFGRRQPQSTPAGSGADQKSAARTEAIWTEMQNTLKEVELNAVSGSHVFSPRHAKALDELRGSQIALAQAWARSEADENATRTEEERIEKFGLGKDGLAPVGRPRSDTGGSVKSVTSVTSMGKNQLEEDTEHDILLARRRREANDRYFQRVNTGVLDVVAKLEEVAKAMKGVEIESREIWGEATSASADSFESGSVAG
ncbi:hypothetical protein NA57DRAFT_35933 [Rhizodiscina lignyota]|uniref:Uncharacterized protein n=1 Tax=Rhizodiscina lignyota TaxID=1504668 RepID=A0A9P4IKL4_9PEZI|nr:hypothetical protein NA57DRAFT_35933 [Rhizodiscina lignyota]